MSSCLRSLGATARRFSSSMAEDGAAATELNSCGMHIAYRLGEPGVVPAAISDCQMALRWLGLNAERFGFREDRIGAVGSSAGGHLVACLGVSDGDEDVSARANCVVDVHGVHDFIALSESQCAVASGCEELIGGAVSDVRDVWLGASPLHGVDEKTVPTLLIHDPQDEIVPYDQSVVFADALLAAHRPMRFVPTPGSGHGFVYNPANDWTQRVWPAMVAWLDEYLLDATSVEQLAAPAPGRSA